MDEHPVLDDFGRVDRGELIDRARQRVLGALRPRDVLSLEEFASVVLITAAAELVARGVGGLVTDDVPGAPPDDKGER